MYRTGHSMLGADEQLNILVDDLVGRLLSEPDVNKEALRSTSHRLMLVDHHSRS